jgi:hypothetical protein
MTVKGRPAVSRLPQYTSEIIKKMVGAAGFEPTTPSPPGSGSELILLRNFWKPGDFLAIDSAALSNAIVNQNPVFGIARTSKVPVRIR